MRPIFASALILVLVGSGFYATTQAGLRCFDPLPYRLGEFDERFGLSSEEARIAINTAAAVWEDTLGRDLYVYDLDADFTINFFFDDRQQRIKAEELLRTRLDANQSVNSAVNEAYEELVRSYEAKEVTYQANVAAYEARLRTYNAEVARYNDAGGAPPAVFERLEAEKAELDRQVQAVNSAGAELNALADQINELGEQGNQLVQRYNERDATYNERIGESREFTQGDYQGDLINIYSFADQSELELVLAHELGHALGLDHVEDETAIMHYLLGAQSPELALSDDDRLAFINRCGEDVSWRSRAQQVLVWFGLRSSASIES